MVLCIADEKGFTVHLFEAGSMDHLHCLISTPPKLSVTQIVKYLKGITGRWLFEAHPEISQSISNLYIKGSTTAFTIICIRSQRPQPITVKRMTFIPL